MSWVMYACAGGNCERHAETSVVHGGGNPRDESGRRAGGNRRGSGASVGERGRVMDGPQECQTPSKRLKAILPVPKWQKQMTEIEAGSHCYELPDTDAFQSIQTVRGGGALLEEPEMDGCLAASLATFTSAVQWSCGCSSTGLFNWTAVLVRGPWNESDIIQI